MTLHETPLERRFQEILAARQGYKSVSALNAAWHNQRLREEMRRRPDLVHQAATWDLSPVPFDPPGDAKRRFAG